MFASRTNWRLDRNRITRVLEEQRKKGAKLFDLTTSNPTTCGLNYPESGIMEALSNRRCLEYRPDSKGLLEAREAIANYYLGRWGFSGGYPKGQIMRKYPERSTPRGNRDGAIRRSGFDVSGLLVFA